MVKNRALGNLEILGTHLGLDFANTINSRVSPEHDYIQSLDDLRGWARRVGLRQNDRESPADPGSLLTHVDSIALRELIYGIFSKLASGEKTDQHELSELRENYVEALSHGSLIETGGHFALSWVTAPFPDGILWQIAYSAADLLMSEKLDLLKECPGCGWLFLDTSKNKSRRWCNMGTCGARDKMRRYNQKRKPADPTP